MREILAGMFIAIASYIYLQFGGIIGAFLFSVGLLVILHMEFKLFTGTVGYIQNWQDVKYNICVLLGNIIGCLFILCLPYQTIAATLVANKLLLSPILVWIKAVVCGMFIYIAVRSFKKGRDYMVIVSVAGFILFGAEHCIADLCFILVARAISLPAILFLLIVIVGNSMGALLLHWIDNK